MKRFLIAALLLTASAGWVTAQEHEKAHAESGHTEEAGDPWIVWKWANFAILVAGLGYLMVKNLPPLFRSRTDSIQKGISEAQQMKRDAEQRAADMDRRVSALGAEIERFRTQARGEMETEGERIRQETAEQIAKIQRQAELEIESYSKTARRELKAYAASLAIELAEQRIKQRVDRDVEVVLGEDFVRNLETQGSRN
jgi:F-type H+-transporting ATPase subunit b